MHLLLTRLQSTTSRLMVHHDIASYWFLKRHLIVNNLQKKRICNMFSYETISISFLVRQLFCLDRWTCLSLPVYQWLIEGWLSSICLLHISLHAHLSYLSCWPIQARMNDGSSPSSFFMNLLWIDMDEKFMCSFLINIFHQW